MILQRNQSELLLVTFHFNRRSNIENGTTQELRNVFHTNKVNISLLYTDRYKISIFIQKAPYYIQLSI